MINSFHAGQKCRCDDIQRKLSRNDSWCLAIRPTPHLCSVSPIWPFSQGKLSTLPHGQGDSPVWLVLFSGAWLKVLPLFRWLLHLVAYILQLATYRSTLQAGGKLSIRSTVVFGLPRVDVATATACSPSESLQKCVKLFYSNINQQWYTWI